MVALIIGTILYIIKDKMYGDFFVSAID